MSTNNDLKVGSIVKILDASESLRERMTNRWFKEPCVIDEIDPTDNSYGLKLLDGTEGDGLNGCWWFYINDLEVFNLNLKRRIK